MSKVKLIIALVIVGLGVVVGGQVCSAVWNNMEFQDDLHDVAEVAATHVGMLVPPSDEELRTQILRKAQERGIPLESKQVSVNRANTEGAWLVDLSATYDVGINLPGYSFTLHFAPTSDKKSFLGMAN